MNIPENILKDLLACAFKLGSTRPIEDKDSEVNKLLEDFTATDQAETVSKKKVEKGN